MSIANLFIVGMPKAGTTSLHQYLAQHPQIFMTADKEPHFFSTDLLAEGEQFHGFAKYTRYPTLNEYHQLYETVQSEQIIGESSVFYLYSQKAAAEIYQYNQSAKIIIMIREPVSFLYSLHSQGVYSGNETERDFEKALKLEKNRKNGDDLPSTVHFPSRLFYLEHIRIREQIQRYLDIFPKENIKIILFDDFKKDTATCYNDVLQFLNIDVSFAPDFTNHNPNTTIRSPELMKVLQDPEHPVAKMAKKVFPRKVLRKGKEFIKKANTKVEDRKPLSAKTEDKLRQQARKEVCALQELLQGEELLEPSRDLLGMWGY